MGALAKPSPCPSFNRALGRPGCEGLDHQIYDQAVIGLQQGASLLIPQFLVLARNTAVLVLHATFGI